jgi:hypothetical protein
MDELSELFGSGRAMLLVGAVLLYVASRAGVDALAGLESSPGRRAVGHWIPIAAAAIVAVAIRRGDLALSIIFATSVGCLSLLIGSIYMVSPNAEVPTPYLRLWPFALPAALLAVLVGFAGEVNWRHAAMLLIEGCVLFYLWQEIGGIESPVIGTIDPPPEAIAKPGRFRWVNAVLCTLIAVIGATAGIIGAMKIGKSLSVLPDTTTVVGVLAPLLVLPMLASGATLAQSERAWAAVTSGVVVVLLNICLLLPIVALLWYLAQTVSGNSFSTIQLNLRSIREATPLPFGWVTWRVDSVVLVVLSFMLIPASAGRWRLGRSEGFMLIVLYAVYVLMEAAASLRS